MVCLASLIARSARCARVSDSLARLHFASPSQPNVAPKMIVLSNVARKIIAGVAIEASLGAATAEPRGKVKKPRGKVKNAVRCPNPKNGQPNGIVIARSALAPISAKQIARGWFVTRRRRNFARIGDWRNAPRNFVPADQMARRQFGAARTLRSVGQAPPRGKTKNAER